MQPCHATAPPFLQRFAIYIVISMPNRESIARGGSQFISISYVCRYFALAVSFVAICCAVIHGRHVHLVSR
jgi:hypothetical protein